jgi:hypothetical protein
MALRSASPIDFSRGAYDSFSVAYMDRVVYHTRIILANFIGSLMKVRAK